MHMLILSLQEEDEELGIFPIPIEDLMLKGIGNLIEKHNGKYRVL
jgi:hypothetical protein